MADKKEEGKKEAKTKVTLTLRPLKERLALQAERYNSVDHWERELRMYERFRDTDPLNGYWKWSADVRRCQQELTRCRTLAVTNKVQE
jgi:hypothetical protein